MLKRLAELGFVIRKRLLFLLRIDAVLLGAAIKVQNRSCERY